MDTPTRLLFLDDHHVDRLDGLRRVLHQPDKRGPVLKPEHPWEGNCVCVFSPPLWIEEEGVWKQYYECRQGDGGIGDGHTYAIAVSADGLTWEKPDLGAVDFGGSTRNNLFATPERRRLVHVVHDPDDPDPQRRYKGLQTVRGARIPVMSADGMRWTRSDVELPSSDAGTIAFDRERRLFMAMLKRANESTVGRSYDVSFSSDFETWSEPRFLFGMDPERDQEMAVDVIRRRLADPAMAKPLFVDPPPGTGWSHAGDFELTPTWRCECYNFGIVPYAGLYLGLATVYYPTGQRLPEKRNGDGFNEIQLAVSRDLETWTRVAERAPWLQTSPLTDGLVGNYDRLQLAAHSGIVAHDDEVRLYYDGMKRRVPQHDRWQDGSPRDPATLSPAERADWLDDAHAAMCLAVLRRDGFVSLRAGDAAGELLTMPLTLSGDGLRLNLDAEDGECVVEVLDVDGRPLPDLSGADAATVRGDGLDLDVPFEAQRLAPHAGRSLRLRLRLRQGDLYAISMA